jgi:hypothetical protein
MQSTNALCSEDQSALVAPATVRHIQNTDIVSRDVAGDTIVVPICRGGADLDSVYMFNSLGRELWLLLAVGRTSDELAEWVITHYQVRPEQAFTDIRNFLAELRELGLIQTT